MDEQGLKELMILRDEEFKKLHEEHRNQEEKLKIYEAKAHLSEAETIEEREIKKTKLALKDRMYRMMAEYRKSL
jgi:uncharacterized protein YdcH (DUF465 family)